jgi:hypothetical protein
VDVRDATQWVDGCLAAAGLRRTGDLELHRERAWATVHRAPIHGGAVWLKVTTPATAAEVRLYAVLVEVVPEFVLLPLGTDPDRGWLLLPDAGVSLAERAGDDDAARVAGLAGALRTYATVQQRLALHIDQVLGAGVPDMRPAALPQRFAEALDAVVPWVRARGTADQRSTLTRLRHFTAEYTQLCADLTARSPLVSIDHNDLHAGNVIGTEARPRCYDWGDSVVGHPYASLLTPTATVPDGVAGALRRAYLEEWPEDAARSATTAALACRLGCVTKALTWHRALSPHSFDHELAFAPFYYLTQLLDAPA